MLISVATTRPFGAARSANQRAIDPPPAPTSRHRQPIRRPDALEHPDRALVQEIFGSFEARPLVLDEQIPHTTHGTHPARSPSG